MVGERDLRNKSTIVSSGLSEWGLVRFQSIKCTCKKMLLLIVLRFSYEYKNGLTHTVAGSRGRHVKIDL